MLVSNNYMKKGRKFYTAMALNLLEGILSGSSIGIIFIAIQSLFENNLDLDRLVRLSISIGCIYLVRIVIYSFGYTQGHVGGADMTKDIRLFLGQKMKRIPLSNFSKRKSGDYINIVTNDVNNYETILTHKAGDILKNSILIALMIVYLMMNNFLIGIICLVVALSIIPVMHFSIKVVSKYGKLKNEILAENVSDVVEYITGLQTFKAYNMAGVKNQKTRESLRDISDINYTYEAKVIPVGTTFNMLGGLMMSISIILAGRAVLDGNLAPSQLVVLVVIPMYLAKLLGVVFIDLTSYKNLVISKKAIVSLAEEKEILDSGEDFAPKGYDIDFHGVNFEYEKGEQVLKNISFKAKEGKLTAIVGDSGSGKSTILNLISKFYDPKSGDISIGKVTIKNKSPEKVLEVISMVDQDVFLFHETIKNNIRFARPEATDKEIIEAAKKANCHDFIQKLEKGYDTIIGENGNQLSGGERQRISIARAILKDSPILLLDEATASLDIENELAVKKAIQNLLSKDRTVIMIAHSLSVIQNAHNILVLSDGRIVERGTHEELIENKGKYYNMLMSEEKLKHGDMKFCI
ncbi:MULTISPECIES: ABC transporter ATP-binding protein [Clostridium]|uniref:ABC transporter ATP-binding protein n=1 Tax=Clostridium TaxID=1485 RepID=UPI0005A60284|nr:MULTISPECIES: ABC transporter ATP-binding protein [Clostridium]